MIKLLVVTSCILTVMAIGTACGSSLASGSEVGIEIHYAGDLAPVADQIQTNFTPPSGRRVRMAATPVPKTKVKVSSAIDDLKNDKCNVALLGREPTPAELEGLASHTIAYDAVCLLLDENSFQGGEWKVNPMPGPIRKSDGMRELSSADVKGMFSERLMKPGEKWLWRDHFYSWGLQADPVTKQVVTDPKTGDPIKGWVLEAKGVYPVLTFPVGKFDTQTVIYRALELNEQEIIGKVPESTLSYPEEQREEEILAYSYTKSSPYVAGGSDFPFKLTFASRRVSGAAVKRIPVRVLSIDGIDPLAQPDKVKDGTYLFPRKIYLLTKASPSSEVDTLVKWVLSPEGQKTLADVGYIPVKELP